MIRVVVTFSISDSVGNEILTKATEWSKKITKYIQSKWPEVEVELLTNYDGVQADIHWSSKHESLSAWERWGEQYNSDDGVKSLMEEAADISKAMGNAILFRNNRTHYYKIVDFS